MAYQIIKIDPLDLKPSTGIGVSLPFNGPGGGFTTTYTTADQLKSNIINYFLTNNNERFFNNNFGGNLRATLFEQITNGSLKEMKNSIQEAMQVYFPEVLVHDVQVVGNPDQNKINVSITYSIENTTINDTIVLAFS